MNATIKRSVCDDCQRPQRACICQWVTPTDNRVELIILQHPLEANNAKNTAGLLSRSLSISQLWIGEQFDGQLLSDLCHASDKTTLLLYPPTPEGESMGLATPAPTPIIDQVADENLRLIVLDATWKKSRKMLYLNTHLQTLPRLSLHDCPESLYTIRKAHSKDQLSTLEASCYALQQLEKNSVDYSLLLTAFKHFIEQQHALAHKR